MIPSILFATPPFTQLNTPYPATAYLKGFLNTKGIQSHQSDLGIEVILKLFSKNGLTRLFESLEGFEGELSENITRIFHLQDYYLQTIDEAISFLQGENDTLAYQICTRNYLPEAARFDQLEDMEWAFGTLGIRDKARHLVTLYLEDLSDLLKATIDPHFGFSRYAERLSLAAVSFDPIYQDLLLPNSLVSDLLEELLEEKIQQYQPNVFCLSIPFPGNLFSGLKCGQYLKKNYPNIKIVLGGGYANTELRSLGEERIFEFVDYICLDDGEASLLHLLEYLRGKRPLNQLKRTFTLQNNVVTYCNGSPEKDIPQRAVGTPDYEGLPIKKYLSVIEQANPMHRLWSDGRWNKMTLAHGCYWGKCTFCDVSLSYIKDYEPITADILCDRIETIIAQTGENGFHFVDEAAPPALMRDLAIEIIKRGITISWWTNIRFEKRFTSDLCQLLKISGCIAVSGGLEVASDRLLKLIKKGVTVSQVASVSSHFTEAGIMVHAYLMYGFPTQTAQETIDALEMVRQLFANGLIQSGFWHRFAMTAHSPIGLNPSAFGVKNLYPGTNIFANNDLIHEDTEGCDHGLFGDGLRKSLYNYMHETGLDFDLQEWFDFEVPATLIDPDFIADSIAFTTAKSPGRNTQILWLGNQPEIHFYEEDHKKMAELVFYNKSEDLALQIDARRGEWLYEMFENLAIYQEKRLTFGSFQQAFEENDLGDFKSFLDSDIWLILKENGLVMV